MNRVIIERSEGHDVVLSQGLERWPLGSEAVGVVVKAGGRFAHAALSLVVRTGGRFGRTVLTLEETRAIARVPAHGKAVSGEHAE